MIHEKYTDKTDFLHIVASKITDIKINKLPLGVTKQFYNLFSKFESESYLQQFLCFF